MNVQNQKYIMLKFCSKKVHGLNVLCEMQRKPDDINSHPIQIQLQLESNFSISHKTLINCPLGHITRDFLACDVETMCWPRDVRSCSAPLMPSPPSFTCANGIEVISITLVCDVRPDCSDGSDESFCEFPPCDLPDPFRCSDRQCVSQSAVCDGQMNCYNSADEDLCSDGRERFTDTPPPPAIVHLTRQGVFTVNALQKWQLANLSRSLCPETHFQCPNDGYCMPVFLRCNGVFDCLGREDEAQCKNYTCRGFFRCRGTQVCVHPQHLCDNVFQCPFHDDELLCDLSCPENCTCYGLAFYCRQPFQARNFTKIRFLDCRGSKMRVSDLSTNIMLVHLSVAENELTTIDELNFPNLRDLDVSDNRVKEIHLRSFEHLSHLETLSLSGNPLATPFQHVSRQNEHNNMWQSTGLPHEFSHTTVSHEKADVKNSSDVKPTLTSLRQLDLSRVRVRTLNLNFLSQLPNLHTVNMSGAGVDTLLGEGFQALTQLRVLDLRGCPLTYFPRDIVQGLQRLVTVYSDNYKLCCPATLPAGFRIQNCHAPSDVISSCQALLRADSYRVFLSVFAFLSLLGNSGSFMYRVFMQKKKLLGFDMLVAHLCVADFLMGVYLTAIGIADQLYQGTYLWEDISWKRSPICSMAGFLSLLSSEVSALIICLITIDRFLVLRFPFSTVRFGTRTAQVASMSVWAVGCLIAAFPLVPEVAHWQFYSQTGICIPLPISRADSPGYTYAFGVMIVANFVFFVVISVGQVFIYWSVQASSMSSFYTSKKSQDLIMARRLITVAMSDFLCWFPIGLLGIMAATGTPISGEVNVAMAIFVLPFNSTLNPFLYTLNVVLEKRQKAEEARIKIRLVDQLYSMDAVDDMITSQDSR